MCGEGFTDVMIANSFIMLGLFTLPIVNGRLFLKAYCSPSENYLTKIMFSLLNQRKWPHMPM